MGPCLWAARDSDPLVSPPRPSGLRPSLGRLGLLHSPSYWHGQRRSPPMPSPWAQVSRTRANPLPVWAVVTQPILWVSHSL